MRVTSPFSSPRMAGNALRNEVPNTLPRSCGTPTPPPRRGLFCFLLSNKGCWLCAWRQKAFKSGLKRQLMNYHSTSARPRWLISDGAEPKCQIMWAIHHPRCSSVPSIPPVGGWWMLPIGPVREQTTALLVAGTLTTKCPAHLGFTFPSPTPPST